jgi:hypothetical protein
MRNARRLVAAVVLGVACGPSGPPPLAPAGIAELVLPADGDTLRRIAAEDDPAGRLERRRTVVAGVDRQLLMPAPDDALVPELFDVVVALAPRMESGAVRPSWGSYLYTTYERELRRDRPTGRPRRTSAEIETVLDGYVEFFRIRADPRAVRATPERGGFEAMQDWRNQNRIGR